MSWESSPLAGKAAADRWPNTTTPPKPSPGATSLATLNQNSLVVINDCILYCVSPFDIV